MSSNSKNVSLGSSRGNYSSVLSDSNLDEQTIDVEIGKVSRVSGSATEGDLKNQKFITTIV
jgi:hypothetical protein